MSARLCPAQGGFQVGAGGWPAPCVWGAWGGHISHTQL